MFPCFKEKSAKRWLEVAFDLTRGLKVAQIAKTSRISTILRAQREPTRGILGPSKAQADQSLLWVSSVLLRENKGSGCFGDSLPGEVDLF